MLLIFINKKMSVFKFSFCSSEMLYYNKYTVYPQSLCMEIAAERLIVILEIVPSVNQWQYLRDDCGWKWLISSTDKQKWYKWSWGHFARRYLCLLGGVCVCVLQYVLSVTVEAAATRSADGSYVSPAWVTQHIYHSSAARVTLNAFPPLVLHT